MNAAPLQRVASPPVAAAPAAPMGTVAGGGITPVGGQGFTPVASGASQGAPAQSGSGEGVDAAQALQAIIQAFGSEYSPKPIITADGSVYLERAQPSLEGGKVSFSYLLVGKVDRATGKMQPSAAVLAKLKAKESSADRQLVKVGDQYMWQTTAQGPDGKPVIQQVPASEQELQAYQQKLQAQQAEQAQKAKVESRGDWQQKIGAVSSQLGLFGSVGQFVTSLAAGPDPRSGKPGANWMTGWFLAQRLNGRAEGKLLPSWLTQGPAATAIEFGLQTYGMLDMGHDIKIVRDYFKKAPPLPPVNPNAVKDLVAKGVHPVQAAALAGLGSELRMPLPNAPQVGAAASQVVEGTRYAAIMRSTVGEGGAVSTAAQLVDKADLHQAWKATDPVQSSGLAAKAAVDGGVTKGLGLLKGLIQPAMMGAAALNVVTSGISLKNMVEKNGAKVLLDTQEGRSTLLNTLSSTAFLGFYLLPMALPALGVGAAASGAVMSATNIAANVLGGVEMLSRYGLFGKGAYGGMMDHDAVRAAFLIPPLTPIGAFAFFMKHRQKKAEAEAAKVKAAQEQAVATAKQQREAAVAQLQASGTVSGAVVGEDGTITVPTSVDVQALTGASAASGSSGESSGASASAAAQAAQQRQQLGMTARPMR